MNMTSVLSGLGLTTAAALLCLTPAGRATGQDRPPQLPERFRAVATNLSGGPGSRATTVEIKLDRMSTDGERDRLLAALRQKGQRALLTALRKAPTAGTIRTPDSLAYDLHYARSQPWGDGGQQILIATDRPIAFWEASHSARSLDYPFTVIEIHVDANGRGEGRMSVATKIIQAGREIVLENYNAQPVLLTSVTLEE